MERGLDESGECAIGPAAAQGSIALKLRDSRFNRSRLYILAASNHSMLFTVVLVAAFGLCSGLAQSRVYVLHGNSVDKSQFERWETKLIGTYCHSASQTKCYQLTKWVIGRFRFRA